MGQFNIKKFLCLGLIAVMVLAFAGCGSSGDLLEETGTRYTAYAVPQSEDEDIQEIDVVFRDCNDDQTDPSFESNYPFEVKVVIEASATAASFYVESYDVRFRRNHGSYYESSTLSWEDLAADEMPDLTGTVLNPLSYSYSTNRIDPSTSIELEGMLVWSNIDKLYYLNTVIGGTEPFGELVEVTPGGYARYEEDYSDLVYDMQIILHCHTIENETFTITTPWTPVHFLDVDGCS